MRDGAHAEQGLKAISTDMTVDKPDGDSGKPGVEPTSKAAHGDTPGWADGLRKLYDSVVDEPLPDSFKDLLAKLDDKSEKGA